MTGLWLTEVKALFRRFSNARLCFELDLAFCEFCKSIDSQLTFRRETREDVPVMGHARGTLRGHVNSRRLGTVDEP